MSFVEIKCIKKHYGQGDSYVDALSDVNMNIEKGQIVVLLGPSGSGKSTLLNIIGAIEDADGGYVAIDGEKIEDMNEKKLTLYRRKHLGYVFQMYNLIPNLTVRENIEVGAYLGKDSLNVDELKCCWKGAAYDDYYDLYDRLCELYKIGMERFFGDSITYIENSKIEDLSKVIVGNDEARETLCRYIRELKYFNNGPFSILDVHNEELFYKDY